MLFAVAAVAMTWIRPPKKQSPVIPLTYRQIMGYDRVLVGTDWSPSSMLAVERAGQVASASEAELVVVTAYDPVPARELAVEGEPADAILATAAEQRADLIVIGNRGMGALAVTRPGARLMARPVLRQPPGSAAKAGRTVSCERVGSCVP
ncbi:MAG TPA: universal stress protein [Streptosporangiaceae bacterium]|nr:universal stress protein [Streptosporangiaceae bacterium]